MEQILRVKQVISRSEERLSNHRDYARRLGANVSDDPGKPTGDSAPAAANVRSLQLGSCRQSNRMTAASRHPVSLRNAKLFLLKSSSSYGPGEGGFSAHPFSRISPNQPLGGRRQYLA